MMPTLKISTDRYGKTRVSVIDENGGRRDITKIIPIESINIEITARGLPIVKISAIALPEADFEAAQIEIDKIPVDIKK